MTTLRATFDGKVLVPEGAVDLPVGKVLEVQVTEVADLPDDLRPGSPAAILKLMRSLPPIPREDLDEMERHIKEGQRPTDFRGFFDDLG